MRIEYIRFSGKVKNTKTVVEVEFVDSILTEAKLQIEEDYGLVETIKLECRKAESWVSEVVDKCYDLVLDLAERVLPEFRTVKVVYRIEQRGEE